MNLAIAPQRISESHMRSFLLFVIFSLPSISFACSCLQGTIKEYVQDANKIYLGTLTSSRIVDTNKDNEWPHIEGTLKVENVIKGKVSSEEKISTGFGGGDCGIPMTIGNVYVIFTKGDSDYIGMCGASRQIPRYKETEYINTLKELAGHAPP